MPKSLSKILIIRFSSLGDIAQAFVAAQLLESQNNHAQVDWVTRSDFTDFISHTPGISKIWPLKRSEGLPGLFRLGLTLRKENYDLVYDAHSNLRSFILSILLWRPGILSIRRPKNRWKRFLLFRFRKNLFENPYRGAFSFLTPLKGLLKLPEAIPSIGWKPVAPAADVRDMILFAPSAAWDLKKWPTEHWQNLISLLPQAKIGLLGGPDDNFADLVSVDPARVQNFAGKMNWSQTAQAIYDCKLLISGDTGALHIADNFNKPAFALIGPTAFGFPSRPNSKVLQVDLWCRPCTKDGRGKCINAEFKKCLKDVTPSVVASHAQEFLL